MRIRKIGFVYACEDRFPWWKSHVMAPAPILYGKNAIRIYAGCWSAERVSRIGFIDVEAQNPTKVLNVSSSPVLDIGRDGCFDENGVFPAHAYRIDEKKVFLYYTGFQLGHKIRHYNFGGLAVSEDGGATFKRHSEAPNLDRADEGLFVRAGQSIEAGDKGFHAVYSSGSQWVSCNNELRPCYDVYYQPSPDGIQMGKTGQKIIACDTAIEHGLGRPQIIRLGNSLFVFYTRRIIKDMRYFMGCARLQEDGTWERRDDLFKEIDFGKEGEFDSQMVYFPAVVRLSDTRAYLFYSGNYYGEGGLGVMEIAL